MCCWCKHRAPTHFPLPEPVPRKAVWSMAAVLLYMGWRYVALWRIREGVNALFESFLPRRTYIYSSPTPSFPLFAVQQTMAKQIAPTKPHCFTSQGAGLAPVWWKELHWLLGEFGWEENVHSHLPSSWLMGTTDLYFPGDLAGCWLFPAYEGPSTSAVVGQLLSFFLPSPAPQHHFCNRQVTSLTCSKGACLLSVTSCGGFPQSLKQSGPWWSLFL